MLISMMRTTTGSASEKLQINMPAGVQEVTRARGSIQAIVVVLKAAEHDQQ